MTFSALDNEHELISKYCKLLNQNRDHFPAEQVPNPAQIVQQLIAERKDELAFLVKQLEEENLYANDIRVLLIRSINSTCSFLQTSTFGI